MYDGGYDVDDEDNFECPPLGPSTFLVTYIQTLVINLSKWTILFFMQITMYTNYAINPSDSTWILPFLNS